MNDLCQTEPEINFFETLYKHLTSDFPTRAETQNFWSKNQLNVSSVW